MSVSRSDGLLRTLWDVVGAPLLGAMLLTLIAATPQEVFLFLFECLLDYLLESKVGQGGE